MQNFLYPFFLRITILFFIFLCYSVNVVKADASVGYNPSQIKAAYGLPPAGGNGTVAIILWGGNENLESDLSKFSSEFNLPSCTTATGCLTIHYMDGVSKTQDDTVFESSMDTEWVHAIAPNAKILYVFSASNGQTDMVNAINYASSQPGVVAVSMSFFNPERTSLPCDFFSNTNISYFAADGDNGSFVGWPADCPSVISVGGTRLIMNGNTVSQETAWSCSYGEKDPKDSTKPACTGGGLSSFIQEPSYQTSFGIPSANSFRGVPDISAIADSSNGVLVISNSELSVGGGTSLSAPIWAGISALGKNPVTHNMLYNNAKNSYSKYFRDIKQGDNGSCGAMCQAGGGYDYLTGLGSPVSLPQISNSTSLSASNTNSGVTTQAPASPATLFIPIDNSNNYGFEPNGTPTPTPDQYFNCKPDPSCIAGGKSIQLCRLTCTPQ